MIRMVAAALLVPSALLARQSFDGSFVHQSPQGPVTLALQQQGSAVTGSMRGADGSMFQLQGELFAEGAAGEISTGDGAGFFAVGFVGEALQLIVAEVDPATGEPDLANGWSLEFTPTPTAQGGPFAGALGSPRNAPQPGSSVPGAQPGPGGGVGTSPGAAGGQSGAQPAVERDPSLIGHWRYTERYSSGDFFANTSWQLLVNPDGTYLYGAGNVSLGGAYTGNTGGGGDVTRGQWRTEGGVVYVMEQGSTQWAPYARYYVEGASMMFTLGDGSRQLWELVR